MVRIDINDHTNKGMSYYKKVYRDIESREVDKAERERTKSANMKQSLITSAQNRAMRRLLATEDKLAS